MEHLKKYCEERIKELEKFPDEFFIMGKVEAFKELLVVINYELKEAEKLINQPKDKPCN